MSTLSNWQQKLKNRQAKVRYNKDRIKYRQGRLKHWQHYVASAKVRIAHLKVAAAQAAAPTVMYDDVNLSLIPPDAKAVAGYTSGKWPTYQHLATQFPNAKHVSIAVTAAHNAEILDVETGDATPPQAVMWMKRQLAGDKLNGRRPGIYCSVSGAQHIVDLLAAAGIARSRYRLWVAHYTGVPHICGVGSFGLKQAADATQWTSHALGRSLDQSLCSPAFWL